MATKISLKLWLLAFCFQIIYSLENPNLSQEDGCKAGKVGEGSYVTDKQSSLLNVSRLLKKAFIASFDIKSFMIYLKCFFLNVRLNSVKRKSPLLLFYFFQNVHCSGIKNDISELTVNTDKLPRNVLAKHCDSTVRFCTRSLAYVMGIHSLQGLLKCRRKSGAVHEGNHFLGRCHCSDFCRDTPYCSDFYPENWQIFPQSSDFCKFLTARRDFCPVRLWLQDIVCIQQIIALFDIWLCSDK